ncbi:MAG: hypothetical protein V1495_02395 [Pseudomonadota bacterium]
MKTKLLVLFVMLAVGSAAAATNYNVLSGNWTGTITTNSKDTTGGGKPTEGTTGTPVTITFSTAGVGLTGDSIVGDSKENWKIENGEYTWNDGEVTVKTTSVSYNDIPTWARTQAKLKAKDTYFAFKYASCTVNKTKAACVPGKDVPDGIDKSGIWLFKVEKDKLQSAVYYTYTNGGKRILEQSLAKKK